MHTEFKAVDEIRRKYSSSGDFIFRCGVSHLMDVGQRSLSSATEEDIEATCEKIRRETESSDIFTADFQIAIVKCAYDMRDLDPWEIIGYIKNEIPLQNTYDFNKAQKIIEHLLEYLWNQKEERRYEFTREDADDLLNSVEMDIEDLNNLGIHAFDNFFKEELENYKVG